VTPRGRLRGGMASSAAGSGGDTLVLTNPEWEEYAPLEPEPLLLGVSQLSPLSGSDSESTPYESGTQLLCAGSAGDTLTASHAEKQRPEQQQQQFAMEVPRPTVWAKRVDKTLRFLAYFVSLLGPGEKRQPLWLLLLGYRIGRHILGIVRGARPITSPDSWNALLCCAEDPTGALELIMPRTMQLLAWRAWLVRSVVGLVGALRMLGERLADSDILKKSGEVSAGSPPVQGQKLVLSMSAIRYLADVAVALESRAFTHEQQMGLGTMSACLSIWLEASKNSPIVLSLTI